MEVVMDLALQEWPVLTELEETGHGIDQPDSN
jgi:hypothetical protein